MCCLAGCNKSSPPTGSDSGPNNSDGAGPADGGAAACPGQTSVILIDEIGLPLANTSVQVQLRGGDKQTLTTDANGMLCFNGPATTGQVDVGNIHEATPGESTKTNSGQHFKAGQGGP
jgi:hypothetical protein